MQGSVNWCEAKEARESLWARKVYDVKQTWIDSNHQMDLQ